MPDAASIIATLAAIKNSIDVLKAVKDADYDINKAILKEKIAVLVDSLVEARIQASETLDLIQEKDNKIAELEKLLAFREQLIFYKGAYYKIDENGKPEGEPYCPRCWEYEQKGIHFYKLGNDFFKCPQCESEVGVPQGIF
jgi:hypothetical protein